MSLCLPKLFDESDQRLSKVPPVNWTPYFGRSCNEFPSLRYRTNGEFSCKRFLGKPLSEELWVALCEVVQPDFLYLKEWNREESGGGIVLGLTVTIYLDETTKISDIRFQF